MAEADDSKVTAEVKPLTDEQLKLAAVDILKDAEVKLGRLGDLQHELRRQVEVIRHRLEATPMGSVEAELREQKDAAYRERNMCVAAIARMAIVDGGSAWLGHHTSATWDEDWRNIVFVELPEVGQVSWHIHDSELAAFAFLPRDNDRVWDGHSTPEKYRRLEAWHAMATQVRR
jgi:hypothetical protein